MSDYSEMKSVHHTMHPFDDIRYDLLENGMIKLSAQDQYGIFDQAGVWIEGALKQADPQLCVWVGNRATSPEEEPTSAVPRRHTISTD